MAEESVEFLFDNKLIASIEDLIKQSKHKLILICPFINLDGRLTDALIEKIQSVDFRLFVLFGKNDGNFHKSIRKESLELFQKFPNVEIRYNNRLHAKFYQNDYEYIISSMNLYDHSFSKNIEVGIKVEYATKGMMGKAIDISASIVEKGVSTIKHDILGMEKEVNPIKKFELIFDSSILMYKTEPVTEEKSRVYGSLNKKGVPNFKVVENKFEDSPRSNKNLLCISRASNDDGEKRKTPATHISASAIAKRNKIQKNQVTAFMKEKGLIDGDIITTLGLTKGIIYKLYSGTEYIAYPINLPELRELKDSSLCS